jgi:transposase
MEKRKNRQLTLKLKSGDIKKLKTLLNGGFESVRVIKRARILQLIDAGHSSNSAAAAVGVTPETARKIGWRYNEEGLEGALYERPRPGNSPLLDKRKEAQIIAIACSEPPSGSAHWTTALLAEVAMKKKIVPQISRETIRLTLKHHGLKPWREKNVVHSG